jgi:antitoxin component YwqK of YwqJK toxin-antitoxin module
MRKIMSLLMLVCGALYMQAQDVNPQYEQQGDLVKATFYHDNGAIAQSGFFRDGKLHGEWVMYNEDGKKVAIGQYNQGIKTGKWFFWEGELLREVDYNNNMIVGVINWRNGEPVAIN